MSQSPAVWLCTTVHAQISTLASNVKRSSTCPHPDTTFVPPAVSDFLDDMYALDPFALTWTRLPAGNTPAPPGRCYHGLAAAGGRLYVFGGLGAAARCSEAPCVGAARAHAETEAEDGAVARCTDCTGGGPREA